MTVYIILLMAAVILPLFIKEKESVLPDGTILSENRRISYYMVISIIMACIIGLRSSYIGLDTYNYEYYYRSMSRQSFSYLLQTGIFDKGFFFVLILCNKLGFSFNAFNMLYAAFNVSVISCLIYKKSKIPWLSFFMYICFDFFVLSLTMMRQTIAISIVIIAVLTDKNSGFRDFLKYTLIVYIASLFHASAIIALPIWFIRKIRINKGFIFITLVLIISASFFRVYLIRFINYFITNYIDRYFLLSEETAGSGTRLYLMILVSVIYALFSKGFFNDKFNQFLWLIMCIVLIIFPAIQIGGAVMRINYYFLIFIIVFVPNLLFNVRMKNKRSAVYLIILWLYLIIGIYLFYGQISQNTYNIVPYEFFWQN